MNSTPNTKDDLIARADEQIASAYGKIASVNEELARVSEQFSKIERDALRDRSVESTSQPRQETPAPQPQHGKPARHGPVGLLSAVAIVGIVAAAFILSRGVAMLSGAVRPPQLASAASLRSNGPSSPAQVTAAEAAPPLTGPQGADSTASTTAEAVRLMQKMKGDIANLEQAVERLKEKQDQIAGDNAKTIEQLKTKQEDMARLLTRISEQSALPKTSPPSAGSIQLPQARMRPQAPPPHRTRPPPWRSYDDEW